MDRVPPAYPYGWGRAAALGVVIMVLLVILLGWLPNELVVRLTRLTRAGRVAVATTWFFVALIGVAWLLRRLQARRVL